MFIDNDFKTDSHTNLENVCIKGLSVIPSLSGTLTV